MMTTGELRQRLGRKLRAVRVALPQKHKLGT